MLFYINLVEAATWFRKAAEQGNTDSQFYLGYCYYRGEGVIENKTEAIEWFRRAIKNDPSEAKKMFIKFAERGRNIDNDILKELGVDNL